MIFCLKQYFYSYDKSILHFETNLFYLEMHLIYLVLESI